MNNVTVRLYPTLPVLKCELRTRTGWLSCSNDRFLTQIAIYQPDIISAQRVWGREAGPLCFVSRSYPPRVLSPSLANYPMQSKRRHQQRFINPASPMRGYTSALPLPGSASQRRQLTPLSPCAMSCTMAAAAAENCNLAERSCLCNNADFQFKAKSCIQGECQPAELDDAQQLLSSECGPASPTAAPTATTPFLPANTNADINETTNPLPNSTSISDDPTTPVSSSEDPSQTVHSSTSISDDPTTQLAAPVSSPPAVSSSEHPSQTVHSSSAGLSNATSSVRKPSPSTSSSPGTIQTRHSNGVPAGAIVASVGAGILIVGLIIFLRFRLQRQRVREHRAPEQFLDSREHMVQTPRANTAIVPADTQPAEAELFQSSELATTLALEESQLKNEAVPASLRAHENLPETNDPVVAPEDSAGVTEVASDEETMTLRMRRLEAQVARMDALLAAGFPEPGSPPSYCG
ncbi:CFEM domain-containing protein [Mycena sanguinolenta]|uniref:CFEM domain-containing protein n=1 Tax=Mycena sanguinolenta TaxID=230812 RepID=A0A8H7DHV2_9AGAR|nr:CFEM domain-containing protein [Mycena sanguinolenta]